MNIDVSVIVPIYNMEKCIKSGLHALLVQKDVQMEVIIIDDGSTDNSQEECKRCIAGHPECTYIRTTNNGAGPARNLGIANAKGEFLYFYDIDDSIEPNALSVMVSALRNSKCDLLVCGYTMTKGGNDPLQVISPSSCMIQGDVVRSNYMPYLKGNNRIQGAPWNKLFRRDTVNQYHLEYPSLRRGQDSVFIMRYVDKARSVCMISDVLYHHLLNNMDRVWCKYRLDYADDVEQLYHYFETIVLPWNMENHEIKEHLYLLYYSDELTAMKVLFSPKWHFSHTQRYARLKNQVSVFHARADKYTNGIVPNEVKKSKYWKMIIYKQCFLLYITLLCITKRAKK